MSKRDAFVLQGLSMTLIFSFNQHSAHLIEKLTEHDPLPISTAVMVSTAASADFHSTFKTLRNEIQQTIDAGQAGPATAQVQSLKQLLQSSVGALPAYDQRQYELQISELEKQVSALRAKERPKSKFSFASRTKPAFSPLSPCSPSPAHGIGGSTAGGSTGAAPLPFTSNAAEGTATSSLNRLNEASRSHSIVNRNLEYITLSALQLVEDEFTLSLQDLSECVVDLRQTRSKYTLHDETTASDYGLRSTTPAPSGSGMLRSIHMSNIHRCVVITDRMDSSAMLHGVRASLIITAAHQFRMHTSSECTILLHVTSVPVIEHCTGLTFGQYPSMTTSPPQPGTTIPPGHALVSRLDELADFDWVRSGPSPNWRKMNVEDCVSLERSLLERLAPVGEVDVLSVLEAVLGPSRNDRAAGTTPTD